MGVGSSTNLVVRESGKRKKKNAGVGLQTTEEGREPKVGASHNSKKMKVVLLRKRGSAGERSAILKKEETDGGGGRVRHLLSITKEQEIVSQSRHSWERQERIGP